jgi:signal transduction histidine kinase
LRSIIETQEKEKEIIAYQIRDSISQTLAYCKMMLQNANKKEADSTLLSDITNIIHQAINEMNGMSRNLSPTLITDFGFKQGLEDYIINFEKQYNLVVQFKCENEEMEELEYIDKISVFRIVQNLLLLLVTGNVHSGVSVTIQYTSSDFSLCFAHDDLQFKIPAQSQEFINIQNRLEYYGGSLTEKTEGEKYILQIGLNMTKSTNS